MPVKYDKIIQAVQQLKDGEFIEIIKGGNIRKCYRDRQGKKHHNLMFNLFDNIAEIIPLRSKLWASSQASGLKSFARFGDNPKPYDGVTGDSVMAVSAFELSMQIMDNKESIFTDVNGHTFKVLEVNGMRGYYYTIKDSPLNGKLSHVEIIATGKKYYPIKEIPVTGKRSSETIEL